MESEPLLSIEHLTVSYGGEPRVKDVSLEVGRGQIVCVVGESGSGKSTLLRAVMSLLPPSGRIESGRVVFEGRDLVRKPEHELASLRGKRLSLIFQNPGSSLDPSVRIGAQIVEVIRQHAGASKQEAKQQALTLLARMRLPDIPGLPIPR